MFLNLSHAHPRLLFTLVFNYKKGSTHHIKGGNKKKAIKINTLERKRRRRLELKRTASAVLTNPAELFGLAFYHS